MTEIDNLYQNLSGMIASLDAKFIDKYLPVTPAMLSNDYRMDVKAYCVLTHAALEEYFEKVAIEVMERLILAIYNKKRRIDRGLIMLIGFYGQGFKIEDENKLIFDYLRSATDESKRQFSHTVFENHGISAKKYLAQLMLPTGIDIPKNPNWLDSLEQLANERGQYAHYGNVQKVLAPEDAKNYVHDCLLLSNEIKIQANKKKIWY